jgi:hypothetical protein
VHPKVAKIPECDAWNWLSRMIINSSPG